MTFHEKIVKLRKMKGLTQDDFASAVGVSRQAVYKWECGQSYPEAAKLIEIKMLFGISIDDLLDETYEVIVPEKKKRKRISKAEAAAIEQQVAAEVAAEDNAGIAAAAPAPAAEPVKVAEPAPAPKAEPVRVEEPAPAPAPKAEPAPVKEEPKAEPVVETKAEPAPAPKRPERVSLFEKLFGKR